jgi:signal transduction histidine kinase
MEPKHNETERIQALKRYEILDTPPDGAFDKLAALAAKIFNVPIAMISLVDEDRIWFKSKHGLNGVEQIRKDPGLCASAILSDNIYIVNDAKNDPRCLTNHFVSNGLGLRFYAAAPLQTHDGHNLGTICIFDKKKKLLTEIQKSALRDLAEIIMAQMELRLETITATKQRDEIVNTVIHDLKNPLTTIPIRADLIKESKDDPQAIDKMCDQIKEAAIKITRMVNEFLETARLEANKTQLQYVKLDLVNTVKRVTAINEALATDKKQKLHLNFHHHPMVFADENKLTVIIDNLINNAIKYSSKGKDITINVLERDSKAVLEVQDTGHGLNEEDKRHVFERFTRLSAKPTGGENSSGLGLSIVKVLVEAHYGKVWVESEGKNKGSKFVVEIPALA